MSKLKQFASFFVTVEDDDDTPKQAETEGKSTQKRVADLPEVHFDEEEDFDIEAIKAACLENTITTPEDK